MSLIEIWLNSTHQDHTLNKAHVYFGFTEERGVRTSVGKACQI